MAARVNEINLCFLKHDVKSTTGLLYLDPRTAVAAMELIYYLIRSKMIMIEEIVK